MAGHRFLRTIYTMKPIGKALRKTIFSVGGLSAAALLAFGILAVPGAPPEGTAAASWVLKPAEADPAPAPAELPGERETLALARSYPARIEGREIREGEWALRVLSRWFVWAGGRMLPPEDLGRREDFVPLRFYSYYRGPRVRPVPTPDQVESLRARNRAGNADTRPRSDAFMDGLYGIASEAEAEETMIPVSFLGRTVRVHPLLAEPLKRAETGIRAAEAADPGLRAFTAGIAQIQGYHWREIAGTERRSYHGYGAAIDVVPKSYGGRFAYWRWAFDAGIEEWWDLPDERIWLVPRAFVDAMEAVGFVWGGKWLWFDTVHFEYRPEVLRMSD